MPPKATTLSVPTPEPNSTGTGNNNNNNSNSNSNNTPGTTTPGEQQTTMIGGVTYEQLMSSMALMVQQALAQALERQELKVKKENKEEEESKVVSPSNSPSPSVLDSSFRFEKCQ